MTVEVVATSPTGTATATFTVTSPSGDGLGTPGARPPVTAPPGPGSTGPRQPPTATYTGAQALAAALAAPIEADGCRYLRRARITSTLNLASVGAARVVFEDCLIDAGQSAWYTIQSNTVLPNWVEFRWCDIAGGAAATVRGGSVRLLRCTIHHGGDLIKPYAGMEIWACWLHDNYKAEGAHCDTMQIVAGCNGLLIHYNTLSGFVSADSAVDPGDWCSGVLQTGPVSAAVGPVVWRGNWISGGRYAIRGSSAQGNGYPVSQLFRDNRFARGTFQYGPTAFIAAGSEDFDTSNVWDDTGQPVLQ